MKFCPVSRQPLRVDFNKGWEIYDMINRPDLNSDISESRAEFNWLRLRTEIDRQWSQQQVWLFSGETGTGKHYLIQQLLNGQQVPEQQRTVFHGQTDAGKIQQHLDRLLQNRWLTSRTNQSPTSACFVLHQIEALGAMEQQQLLQLLETEIAQRLTIRWLLSTRIDLAEAVQQNQFSASLYYRLRLVEHQLPPLRQRRIELQSFIREFVRFFSRHYNIRIERIEQYWMNAFLQYPWPGNIRELKYAVEQSVLRSSNGILSREQIPHQLQWSQAASTASHDSLMTIRNETDASHTPLEEEPETLQQSVALAEKQQIEQALERNFFSRTRTAQDLGISRVTLYNKMKKLGLDC